MNRAILRRWLDVVVLSMLGAITGCFFLVWQQSLCILATRLLSVLPFWWPEIVIIVAATIILNVYLRISPFFLGQIPYVLRYPPTWMAILLATSFTFALQYIIGHDAYCYDAMAWLLALATVALASALQWIIQAITNFQVDSVPTKLPPISCAKSNSDSAAPNFSTIADNWESLKVWFATDLPITARSHDLFYRMAIVRRFADRLLLPLDKDTTIGLIGEYGSGKTSLFELVKEEISARQTHGASSALFCHVDCWGFENSGAALQSILSRVLGELSKKVDCLAISQLPESYRRLLAGGGGWWASLASLVGDSNPESQLQRLGPILIAMNVRLVLIIEELDRPQSSHFDLQDIAATLCHLKSVRGVSYILAGNKDVKRHIPFMKLCDYSEDLRLDTDSILRAISTMRQASLHEYADIDPMPSQTRDSLETSLGVDQATSRYIQWSWFGDDSSLSTAILRLVNTPRLLKHILRHTCGLWQTLHGEIDFDDLFVCTILRFTAEEAIYFIKEHRNVLQMDVRSQSSSESDKAAAERRKQFIQTKWGETIEKVKWDAAAAKTLLLFLFPNAADYFGERYIENRVAPQGVRHSEPTNYWSRMLAGEIAQSELRDQFVLKSMVEWSQSPSSSTTANSLCSSRAFVERWGHFCEWLPVPNLLDLAGQVLDILRDRDGARASCDHDGINALWRVAKRIVTKDENSRKWVLDQILHSLPISLHLLNDLYHYWASTRYGVLKNERDRNEVRQGLAESVRGFLNADNPDALINILDPLHTYSVSQLVQPIDDDEPNSILANPSDWQWLSPILLAAAPHAPALIIPEIVYLVTSSGRNFTGQVTTQWNMDILEKMFTSSMRDMMLTLLMDFQVTTEYPDPLVETNIQNARSLARQWLDEHDSSHNRKSEESG